MKNHNLNPFLYNVDLKTGKFSSPKSSAPASYAGDELLCVIRRKEIELARTRQLIANLAIRPDSPFVQAGPRRTRFVVLGYENDTRDLVEIPAFVGFARKLLRADPCLLYFASPNNGFAKRVFIAACKDQLQRRPDGTIDVFVPPGSVKEYLYSQVDNFDCLCAMAGLNEGDAFAELLNALDEFES